MNRLFSYVSMFFLLFICTSGAFSQGRRLSHVDSVLHALDTAKSVPGRVALFMEMARCTMDRAKAEEYATQAIELAQMSRDQRLIADVYIQDGNRYLGN